LGASIQQLQSPHRDKRSVHGARVDAHPPTQAGTGNIHGVTTCAPSPDLGEEPEASRTARAGPNKIRCLKSLLVIPDARSASRNPGAPNPVIAAPGFLLSQECRSRGS